MISNTGVVGLVATLLRTRLIAPLRPDKYLRMAEAIRREGISATVGFAVAAQRCPDRPGLIDEIGPLTWKQLDDRIDALAAALQALPGGGPDRLGVMCRNHRGFIEAIVAAGRIGADVLLLNTAFAGPALAEVIARECVDTVIYDEEFTSTVDRAVDHTSLLTRILGWTESLGGTSILTVEKLIDEHAGERPRHTERKGKVILLTSGTTGTPKGAKAPSSGGAGELQALLERVPWRAEEATVIAAPMFHAWGYSQLLCSALMACTIITRRTFDPEATLQLIDRYHATGLAVVPVMFDRIMDLPDDVRNRYRCRSLRFATASGSRIRPDVAIEFMDQFGDVIFNNYNATEAGMIATATPEDLRAAPYTAGKPVYGRHIRILDENHHDLPAGEVGQIFVRGGTQFEGYTSGTTKNFHEGFMASGDLGYLDDAGRLFVVGRDDEMVVSGGENVYPVEVEKTLVGHPDVAEAAVIGVDDEQYGQRLAAFVVLHSGAKSTPEALRQYIRDNLARYKAPRDVWILEELPRGSTGKIVRSELQSLAARDNHDAEKPIGVREERYPDRR